MVEEKKDNVIHLFQGHGKNTIITQVIDNQKEKKRKIGNFDAPYIVAFVSTLVFFIWNIWRKNWGNSTKIIVSTFAFFFSIYLSITVALISIFF